MGEGNETDDWEVECSDDEKYDPSGTNKGVWEPDPKDIKDLYERISKGEHLTLEWKCVHGRRPPTPEKTEENMDTATQQEEQPKLIEKVAPTEFDFDEFGVAETNPITPRRTPGSSKTPKSTKRVARLDKIMDDIRRHKKLNEEGDKVAKLPKTPTGSPGSTPQRPNKGNMSPKKLS